MLSITWLPQKILIIFDPPLAHLSPTPGREPLAVLCFAFEGVTLIGSHAELPTSKQHVFSLWYLLLIRSLQLHSNPENKNETNCVFQIFAALSPSHLSIAPPSLRYGHTSPAAARRDRCSRQRRRALGCQSFRRTGAASVHPSVSWLAKRAEEEHVSSSHMEQVVQTLL